MTNVFQPRVYEYIASTLHVNPKIGIVPDLPHIRIRVEERYFRPREELSWKADVVEYSSQPVNLVVGLYKHLIESGGTPAYVCGLGPGDIEAPPTTAYPGAFTAAAIRDGRVEFVALLQVLPPKVVATFDQETLLSAPASRNEQLPDGGVVLVVDTSPTMTEAKDEPESVASHLSV